MRPLSSAAQDASAEVKVNVVSAASAASTSPMSIWRWRRAPSSSASIRAPTVPDARKRVQETGVDVRYYSIIYELLDDITTPSPACSAPRTRRADRRHRAGYATYSAAPSSAPSPAAW